MYFRLVAVVIILLSCSNAHVYAEQSLNDVNTNKPDGYFLELNNGVMFPSVHFRYHKLGYSGTYTDSEAITAKFKLLHSGLFPSVEESNKRHPFHIRLIFSEKQQSSGLLMAVALGFTLAMIPADFEYNYQLLSIVSLNNKVVATYHYGISENVKKKAFDWGAMNDKVGALSFLIDEFLGDMVRDVKLQKTIAEQLRDHDR